MNSLGNNTGLGILSLSLVYLVCRKLISSSSIKWEKLLICISILELQKNIVILPSEHYFTCLVEQPLWRGHKMNSHIYSLILCASNAMKFYHCVASATLYVVSIMQMVHFFSVDTAKVLSCLHNCIIPLQEWPTQVNTPLQTHLHAWK